MKGICFIPPLYDATIEGVKCQTRRIVVCPPNAYGGLEAHLKNGKIIHIVALDENERSEKKDGSEWLVKPKYKVGDIIYLKEPYKLEEYSVGLYQIYYKFGGEPMLIDISELKISKNQIDKIIKQQNKSKSGYANKLFMPAWCARRFIKITGVRAERLQDITEEDCIKEGITLDMAMSANGWIPTYNDPDSGGEPNYIAAYACLIDSINCKGTWDSNPYVWVYDYKLTDKPEKL